MKVMGNSTAFLFEVYVVDFGDNYHRLPTEPSSELEIEARRIRRRYKNLTDYMRALAIYQEYMSLLAQKHGGPRLFKIKLKNELVEDFVPPKPRMKNTEMNKFILKNKIIVGNIKSVKIDEELLEKYVEDVSDEQHVEVLEPTAAFDPIANRVIKEEGSSLVSIKKVQKISNIDYLEEYFKTKNVIKHEEEIKDVPSIKEIMSGEYLDKIKDTSDTDDVLFYKGNYMHRDSVEELQVYQTLGDLGWNSLKVMKSKDVSKNITRIMKERTKKDKKKKGKKNDDFLVQVMTDGDYENFDAFQEDMLNFSSANIFK